MGAGFSTFLKNVAEFFTSLFKMLTQFPHNIVCAVKLLVVGFIWFMCKIPGIDICMALLVGVWQYLLHIIPQLLIFTLTAVIMGVVWVLDLIPLAIGKPATVGTRLSQLITDFTTCANDPRSWYKTSRWHMGNRYGKLMGMFTCMCPCSGSYEPSPSGILCQRSAGSAFCPASIITQVVDGDDPAPGPGTKVAGADDSGCWGALASVGKMQRQLMQIACRQPGQFDSPALRGACFAQFCTHAGTGEAGKQSAAGSVMRCEPLVPFKGTAQAGAAEIMIMLPALIGSAAMFVMVINSAVDRQQAWYSRQAHEWLREAVL